MASFFTTLPPAPSARPGGCPSLKVLPSTLIPWACKVENELDPSHVLPCCHLVSFLFFRLKWPQNIGSSEIVRISNRVIYAGRDLTGEPGIGSHILLLPSLVRSSHFWWGLWGVICFAPAVVPSLPPRRWPQSRQLSSLPPRASK